MRVRCSVMICKNRSLSVFSVQFEPATSVFIIVFPHHRYQPMYSCALEQ